jgi:TonB family protein
VATGTPENTGTGTYEEIWVSPEKWRKEITFGNYHRILVRKGDKTYRLTAAAPPPGVNYKIEEYLLPDVCPCPGMDDVAKKVELQRIKLGNTEVIRIGAGKISGGKIPLPDNAQYFSAGNNLLLMSTRGYEVASYVRSGMLAGKLAMLDFNVADGGKTVLEVKFDQLVSDPAVADAMFTIPDSAKAISGPTVNLPASDVKARCIRCPAPRYPEEAKLNKIQGTVVLRGTIDRQGAVRELAVVSSPNVALSQAALDAVYTWRYTPVVIDEEPTFVITEIHVNFVMSH